jgi:hypothetical protein
MQQTPSQRLLTDPDDSMTSLQRLSVGHGLG